MRATRTQTDTTEYNVYCEACGAVFTPAVRSSLWWRAKQRADRGYLDALTITSEVHQCYGTKRPRRKPEAPFRVMGFDCFCKDFDIPFDTFTGAVTEFRARSGSRSLDTVFITGVSEAVKDRIMFGPR